MKNEPTSDWLDDQERGGRQKAVLAYATSMAGTGFDLDPALESAGIEELNRDQMTRGEAFGGAPGGKKADGTEQCCGSAE